MELFPKEVMDKLLANGRKQDPVRGSDQEIDFEPAVKLFMVTTGWQWLISEAGFSDPDIVWGLCDMGDGPEYGYMSISELEGLRDRLGLGVERDLYWKPSATLESYARRARLAGANA